MSVTSPGMFFMAEAHSLFRFLSAGLSVFTSNQEGKDQELTMNTKQQESSLHLLLPSWAMGLDQASSPFSPAA